jgi:hypothetical protein
MAHLAAKDPLILQTENPGKEQMLPWGRDCPRN